MQAPLRTKLVASARAVIRWCTPADSRILWPSFWPGPDIHPSDFAGRWHEPAYVASFVLYGIPRLAAEWAGPLDSTGVGIRITGVFCHQSPKVVMTRSAWPAEGECELGDLLIVHDHWERGKVAKRRAVLVQAKMPYATGHFADNPRQTFLYERWPTFWITKPATFDTKRPWELAGNSDGARYALITAGTPQRRYLFPRSPWAFIPCADGIASNGEDMARFLVAMLDFDGAATRGRPATEGGADQWSALIDEMLKKLKLRQFSNKQLIGRARGPRVVTAFTRDLGVDGTLQFVCAGSVPGGMGGGGDPEPAAPEGAGPGISTVLIETSVGPD